MRVEQRLTLEQFAALKHGDIVQVFTNEDSECSHYSLRTVLLGPADDEEPWDGRTTALYLHFPIKKRSWTGRCYTCQCWNDLKRKLKPTGKRLSGLAASPEELERLFLSGFDVAKAIAREFKDDPFGLAVPRSFKRHKCSKLWAGTIERTLQTAQKLFA